MRSSIPSLRLLFTLGLGALACAEAPHAPAWTPPAVDAQIANVDAGGGSFTLGHDAGRDAMLSRDAGRDGGEVTTDAGTLHPYPLDQGACEEDAGFICCHSVQCVQIDNAQSCPGIDEPGTPPLFSPGVEGCEGSGPYTRNPQDVNPPPAGNCCYLSASQYYRSG